MGIGTNLNNNQYLLFKDEVTIAASGTTTSSFNLQGRVLVGISMPAAISGTAFTFESSHDGVNFQGLHDKDNSAIGLAYTAAKNYTLSPDLFAGVQHLRLVSNNAQAAAKLITVITRKID